MRRCKGVEMCFGEKTFLKMHPLEIPYMKRCFLWSQKNQCLEQTIGYSLWCFWLVRSSGSYYGFFAFLCHNRPSEVKRAVA